MSGERYYTTKIWQRPSSIGFSSADALSTSMDPPGEPVISTWNRPCQQIQNGSVFPELAAQNFRNPQIVYLVPRDSFAWGEAYSEMDGKLVAATGILSFSRSTAAELADTAMARAPGYFYFEVETAQLRLITH